MARRRTAPKFESLSEALIAVFSDPENPAPMKAGEAIKQAMALHPPAKGGKTQAATASTAILNLTRKGKLIKTGPAMYTVPERAPAPKRRSRSQPARIPRPARYGGLFSSARPAHAESATRRDQRFD